MVNFKIKVNQQQRLTYIPKAIVDAMGLEFTLVANRAAIVMYPKNTALKDVVKSLQILLQDFTHAIEMQEASKK